ncbi:MAG: hypothetical protein LC635_06290 [Pseudonocardiaceae bacterium]|nr:hypothetical protein [Pseudonocardiaceae bacterium]
MSDRREHVEPELPDFDDEAIDLALVHADDEYLDLLADARLDDRDRTRDGELGDFADERLTELLMLWRRDVDAEPIGELVDARLATVTVQAARLRKKRRPRLLVPLAAAAAVLAIAFAGVGLAARDAQPGDALWALTKVLYADHARSVEAAEEVKNDLREARAALTEGDLAEAKSKLEDAHAVLPTVSSEDGKTDLEAQHASLVAQLPGNPSGEAGQPPTPDPSTRPDPGVGGGNGDGSSGAAPTDTVPEQTSPTSPVDTTPPTEPTEPTTETPPRSEEGTSAPLPGETPEDADAEGDPAAAPTAAP